MKRTPLKAKQKESTKLRRKSSDRVNQMTLKMFWSVDTPESRTRGSVSGRCANDVRLKEWLQASIRAWRRNDTIQRNCAILFQWQSHELPAILKEVGNYKLITLSVERYVSECASVCILNTPSTIVDVDELLSLFVIPITSPSELDAVVSMLNHSALYIFTMKDIVTFRVIDIIPCVGLLLFPRDDPDFISSQVAAAARGQGVNVTKLHIKRVGELYKQCSLSFLFILHTLFLVTQGVCQVSIDTEDLQPLELIRRFFDESLSRNQVVAYATNNREIRDLVYWYCVSVQSCQLLRRSYCSICTADVYTAIKPKFRREIVDGLIATHSVVIPISITKQRIEEQQHLITKKKRMDDIVEGRRLVRSTLFNSSQSITRCRFSESVFPFIATAMLKSTTQTNKEVMQVAREMGVTPRAWKTLFSFSPYKERLSSSPAWKQSMISSLW